jgi:hypothetical protein
MKNGLFPENETTPVIKSISYSQDAILQSIIYLFIPAGRIHLDPCYNKGGFYRSGKITAPAPEFRYDINPIPGTQSQKGDCRNLPITDNSIESIIFDPPFLTTNPTGKEKENSNIMHSRFSSFKNMTEFQFFMIDSVAEFQRVLIPGGILIVKCQDTVRSGTQYWVHITVKNIATDYFFTPEDLFILLAKNRPISGKIKRQQHARKFHSYFWVFRKGK